MYIRKAKHSYFVLIPNLIIVWMIQVISNIWRKKQNKKKKTKKKNLK